MPALLLHNQGPTRFPFPGALEASSLPSAHGGSLLPVCLAASKAVPWAGIAGQALAQQLWCQAWGPAGRAALAGPSASAGTATTALDLAICRVCLPDASLPKPPMDLLMGGEKYGVVEEGREE